jgi:hypothetical protein
MIVVRLDILLDILLDAVQLVLYRMTVSFTTPRRFNPAHKERGFHERLIKSPRTST